MLAASQREPAELTQADKDAVKAQIEKYRQAALAAVTPAGAPAVNDRDAFIEVHRRQPDGTWIYTHLVHHSIEPLPSVPPAPKN